MSWSADQHELAALEPETHAALGRLTPMDVPAGACLFSPGEAVKGYVIVLSGRVGVRMTGPNGREILLYEVRPGQSCIQSTLGLMGGDDYTAEATASEPTRLVLMPRAEFLRLIDASPAFRRMVFAAFAARMQSMMQLVEAISFMRIEERLAALILDRADASGHLEMTQNDMAVAIGSAREVVSRRLERLEQAGLIRHGRGEVTILDRDGLEKVKAAPAV